MKYSYSLFAFLMCSSLLNSIPSIQNTRSIEQNITRSSKTRLENAIQLFEEKQFAEACPLLEEQTREGSIIAATYLGYLYNIDSMRNIFKSKCDFFIEEQNQDQTLRNYLLELFKFDKVEAEKDFLLSSLYVAYKNEIGKREKKVLQQLANATPNNRFSYILSKYPILDAKNTPTVESTANSLLEDPLSFSSQIKKVLNPKELEILNKLKTHYSSEIFENHLDTFLSNKLQKAFQIAHDILYLGNVEENKRDIYLKEKNLHAHNALQILEKNISIFSNTFFLLSNHYKDKNTFLFNDILASDVNGLYSIKIHNPDRSLTTLFEEAQLFRHLVYYGFYKKNSEALFQIAEILLDNPNLYSNAGNSISYQQARKILRIAADGGYPKAQKEYAWLCLKGIGGSHNMDDALKYFKLAADSDDITVKYNAAHNYAALYNLKSSSSQELLEVKKYFKLSADGEIVLKGPNEERIKYRSAFNYAELCHSNNSILQNLSEAKQYYKLVADNDIAPFKYEAAYLYGQLCTSTSNTLENSQINQDRAEAKKYFKLLADLADSETNINLEESSLYITNPSNEKLNQNQFLSDQALYFRGAAQLNYARLSYEDKNYEEAIKYLDLACKSPLSIIKQEAYLQFGSMYNFGKGVEHNILRARKYYEKAIKLVDSDAKICAQVLYIRTFIDLYNAKPDSGKKTIPSPKCKKFFNALLETAANGSLYALELLKKFNLESFFQKEEKSAEKKKMPFEVNIIDEENSTEEISQDHSDTELVEENVSDTPTSTEESYPSGVYEEPHIKVEIIKKDIQEYLFKQISVPSQESPIEKIRNKDTRSFVECFLTGSQAAKNLSCKNLDKILQDLGCVLSRTKSGFKAIYKNENRTKSIFTWHTQHKGSHGDLDRGSFRSQLKLFLSFMGFSEEHLKNRESSDLTYDKGDLE